VVHSHVNKLACGPAEQREREQRQEECTPDTHSPVFALAQKSNRCDWQHAPRVHQLVYLRCPPAICAARLAKRDREAERGLPADYLQAVHDAHETWLTADPTGTGGVTVLDASGTEQQVLEAFKRLC
jgi:deoxyadenosine/deoxycytidine kinase